MHRTRNVLQTSSHQVTDLDSLTDALAAVADCAASCGACADACLGEESVGMLSRCISLNLDCSAVCQATAALLCRPGNTHADVLEAQLNACTAACAACGEECAKHADRHEHCKACADACDQCMQVCRDLVRSSQSVTI
ncbi:MAG: four-helix bundle copper-binding protein [Planctomycetes bacterium]|nr:four-helix bundle copper-binding protein [Planctomycetota bacterium]